MCIRFRYLYTFPVFVYVFGIVYVSGICIRFRYAYTFPVCVLSRRHFWPSGQKWRLHRFSVFVYVSGMRSKSASFLPLRAKMAPPLFFGMCICFPPQEKRLLLSSSSPPPHLPRGVSACRRRFFSSKKTRSWNFEHVQVPKSVKMSKN